MPVPILRIARPTDDLIPLLRFYCDGLGFQVLHRFEDHEGFDGMMIGHPAAPWHLEFTRSHDHRAGRSPTEDNLLVLYIPDQVAWTAAVAQMGATGFEPVSSHNPYWKRRGATFEDADGYRVVLQNADWSL